MKLSEFYYDLPEELIAQFPIEKRDELVYDNAECKLLVLNNELEIEQIIFKVFLQ